MTTKRLNGRDSRFTFYASLFLPFAALTTLVLLFFNKMAFSNLILARGDTFLYFYPYWEAAAEALRNGRIPLWNPDLFMGAPFLANSQVGFFYPLNWPVWLLLPTPYAVSASIVVHVMIAGWGAYLAGRRALLLSREAAWLTAVLFALGGYLTAQVEHVNQLQGLAWLPWFFVVVGTARLETRDWRLVLRRGTAVALLFSLQLLAGHTQTAFITGVAIGIYLLADSPRFTFRVSRFTSLLLGVLLALLVTAVQLLPTLELTRLSSRQGGLLVNEVLSFSLHPLLVSRSLLPAYGQSLFTEYVAFLPLTALVLATIGAWQWRQQAAVRPYIILSGMGFLLALGRFTPLYWLLARLPGFDLFRVPARWLVLYAWGMAMLAGVGWDVIKAGWQRGEVGGQRPLRWATAFIFLLMGWRFLSVPLARFIPLGPETPAAYPEWQTAVGWLIELAALWGCFRFAVSWRRFVPVGLIALSLFMVSRTLPYNNLTTPEAYFDLRPPISRLQTDVGTPPGRLLSLSDIFFNPGDQGEIDTIYADQLPEQARYDYTVAIKQKEIIAPNLPLAFGIPSVDGFDGGILPISSYSDLLQVVLPNQVRTTDGRLRELLMTGGEPILPAPHWLDLFNAQYLITDKTRDVWRAVSPGQDVFFDLQHPVTLSAGESVAVGYIPSFPAAGLAIIGGPQVGAVKITTADETWVLTPQRVVDDLWRVDWPVTAVVQTITLTAPAASPWQIRGLTLFNDESQTFQSLVPGQYRLLHSGDVKVYENMDVLPRAFVTGNWQWQGDNASSAAAMSASAFDPRELVMLTGSGDNQMLEMSAGKAEITEYEPERVVVQVVNDAPGLLVLTDAYYPGWSATLDGDSLSIYQADGFFRAIMLPMGEHTVVFSFEPASFKNGRLLSFSGIFIGVLLFSVSNRIGKKQDRI